MKRAHKQHCGYISEDKVVTIDEAIEQGLAGHHWDIIADQTKLPAEHYGKHCLFELIGDDLAAIFANKQLSVNCYTGSKHHLTFHAYKKCHGTCIHGAYYGLLSRVNYWFKKKFKINVNQKNLRYFAQFDYNLYWMLVTDVKSDKTLIFLAM